MSGGQTDRDVEQILLYFLLAQQLVYAGLEVSDAQEPMKLVALVWQCRLGELLKCHS